MEVVLLLLSKDGQPLRDWWGSGTARGSWEGQKRDQGAFLSRRGVTGSEEDSWISHEEWTVRWILLVCRRHPCSLAETPPEFLDMCTRPARSHVQCPPLLQEPLEIKQMPPERNESFSGLVSLTS